MSPPAPQNAVPDLECEIVHVWRAHVKELEQDIGSLLRLLVREELSKAARFATSEARDRYIIGRAGLKTILSHYAGISAEAIRIRPGRNSKPILERQQSHRQIQFNISHSHELVLYAIAFDQEVGIDVEQIRPESASTWIAEHFFSPQQVRFLSNLPAHEYGQYFFRLWTRLEAGIKAFAENLDAGAMLSRHFEESCSSTLQDLAPGKGYAGAIATKGLLRHIEYFELSSGLRVIRGPWR